MAGVELTPEQLQAILGMGGLDQRADLLRSQLAQSEALKNATASRHTTGGGAALGGIGALLRQGAGMLGESEAKRKLGEVAELRGGAREGYVDALRGAEPEQQRELAFTGLASGDEALGRIATHQLGTLERGEQRSFQELLAERQQGFTAAENEKNRALQREAFGQRDRLATESAEREAAAAARTEGGRLRRELMGNPALKEAVTVGVAYDKLQRAASSGSAAGDMSMIFAFMKLLDPGSTVREGEYANARNAGGVPDQIINLYNKAKDGQLLNPAQRQDFLSQGRGLYEAQAAPARKLYQSYMGFAQQAGLNPSEIFPDLGFAADSAEGGGGEPRRIDLGDGRFVREDPSAPDGYVLEEP